MANIPVWCCIRKIPPPDDSALYSISLVYLFKGTALGDWVDVSAVPGPVLKWLLENHYLWAVANEHYVLVNPDPQSESFWLNGEHYIPNTLVKIPNSEIPLWAAHFKSKRAMIIHSDIAYPQFKNKPHTYTYVHLSPSKALLVVKESEKYPYPAWIGKNCEGGLGKAFNSPPPAIPKLYVPEHEVETPDDDTLPFGIT